jgi:prepilin-type N-terminal cleavage/methylation domain-containing protein
MSNVRRGFTLVEMLVVIAIISILAGLALTALITARRTSKENAIRAQLKVIESALERYENDFNDYPASDGDTDGIVGSENLYRSLSTELKEGPYFKAGDLKTMDSNQNGELEIADEFNRPIRYWHRRDYQNRPPNKRTFRLLSTGADGVNENGIPSSDDIVNWDKLKPEQQ